MPLANATFAVEKNNTEVTSFITDDQGRFRVSLPPGHYKISLKGRKSSIGRFGPFEARCCIRQDDKGSVGVRLGYSIVVER